MNDQTGVFIQTGGTEPLVVRCPKCDHAYFLLLDLMDVGDLILGRRVRCAACLHEFKVTGKCLK